MNDEGGAPFRARYISNPQARSPISSTLCRHHHSRSGDRSLLDVMNLVPTPYSRAPRPLAASG